MKVVDNDYAVHNSEHKDILTSDNLPNVLSKTEINQTDKLKATIDELININAHQYDPVRFRFIESMAEKALRYPLSVAQAIEKKTMQALADYVKHYEAQKNHAKHLIDDIKSKAPELAARSEQLFNEGDINQIQRISNQLSLNKHIKGLVKLTKVLNHDTDIDLKVSNKTLDDELKQQEYHVLCNIRGLNNLTAQLNIEQSKTDTNELRAMRAFRQSSVKHSFEHNVNRIFQEAPKDAGPLNSQALVIHSLKQMHKLSPSYLKRFIAYMDTLFWLEKAGEEGATKKNKTRRKS